MYGRSPGGEFFAQDVFVHVEIHSCREPEGAPRQVNVVASRHRWLQTIAVSASSEV